MARADYEIAVRRVLVVALGYPDDKVLFSPFEGPQDLDTYAVVSVQPPRAIGTSTASMDDAEVYEINTFYEGSCQVQLFGPGARQDGTDLVAVIGKDPAVNIAEHANRVALSASGTIEPFELAPVRDTEFDRRTVVELMYSFDRVITRSAIPVETFSASGDTNQ